MSACRTYHHAQDIDGLSSPGQGMGDGHDIRVVTLLQGVGYEGVGRFAGGGKAMARRSEGHHFADAGIMMDKARWVPVIDHFADAGKMVGQREADGPFSPLLFMTACEEAERSTGCY